MLSFQCKGVHFYSGVNFTFPVWCLNKSIWEEIEYASQNGLNSFPVCFPISNYLGRNKVLVLLSLFCVFITVFGKKLNILLQMDSILSLFVSQFQIIWEEIRCQFCFPCSESLLFMYLFGKHLNILPQMVSILSLFDNSKLLGE